MNLVMTGSGKIIEIQGTAEKVPFEEKVLLELIALGKKGIQEIVSHEQKAIA